MFVNGLKSSCMGCTAETGRQAIPVNCHTYCERYLDFCKKNEKNKSIKRKDKKTRVDYYEVRRKGFKRPQK